MTRRYGIGTPHADKIRKSGGGHLDGLPHAPAWDCPGADAIREARMEAHRRIIADLREAEAKRRAGDKLMAIAREEAIKELRRLSEVLGSSAKEGGAAARLERFEDLVTRCERLRVPRNDIIKGLHIPNVALVDFLAARGFPPRNPPKRKNKTD